MADLEEGREARPGILSLYVHNLPREGGNHGSVGFNEGRYSVRGTKEYENWKRWILIYTVHCLVIGPTKIVNVRSVSYSIT